MADTTAITSGQYDIYAKLFDIAASGEYIASSEDITNVDFLRTGVFGYTLESLALMFQESTFHKTMIYKESQLYTAVMPKSIYNRAKLFNISPIDARPSLRYAQIQISTEVIDTIIQKCTGSIASYKIKYGISEASNFMVLDKINPISASSYTFMLEHSVEIYKNSRGKYIVKYCLNEEDKTTEFGAYSNGGLINTSFVTDGNTKYLVFNVLVAQYKIVEESRIITGSTFQDVKVHTFNYSNYLCGLALKYTKGATTENVKLKFSNMEKDEDLTSETKVAYYSIIDDNQLEISFTTNNVAGLPQSGGVLTLSTFVTEGFSGNIGYSGEAVFVIKQNDFKSLPISVTLANDIYGSGKDQTTLSELKNVIINKLSTHDTIITENDLNTWFATQASLLTDVNNSSITFIKENDNLLKRTFSASLLLRDGVALDNYISSTTSTVPSSYISTIVPTNTIDIIYNIQKDDSNDEIKISPSNEISYNTLSKAFYVGDVGNTDYNYKTPFNIILNRKYNKVSYFYLETSQTSDVEFTDVTSMTGLSIIPTSLDVNHTNPNSNSTGNDVYKFKFTVAADDDLTTKSISNASIIFGTNKVSLNDIKLEFKEQSADSSDEEDSLLSYYYVEIEGAVDGNDSIKTSSSSSNQIKLTFGDIDAIINMKCKIGLSLSFDDNSYSGTFTSTDEIQIFTALDDVMSSDIIVNKNSEDEIISYTIKDVPVIAAYWIDSDINRKWFIRQLFVYINMLKANIEKLETSTFFNIKFRNAYGASNYYNSINTQLRLALTIHIDRDKAMLYGSELNLTSEDEIIKSLEKTIRDFIRVAVDSANDDGELVISKIIMKTQATYYNFIKYIEFNGLNGTFNQYVKKIETNDTSFPLEYFSLDNTLETTETGKVSRLEKDIVFVFE